MLNTDKTFSGLTLRPLVEAHHLGTNEKKLNTPNDGAEKVKINVSSIITFESMPTCNILNNDSVIIRVIFLRCYVPSPTEPRLYFPVFFKC